jgi:hypothetical protein
LQKDTGLFMKRYRTFWEKIQDFFLKVTGLDLCGKWFTDLLVIQKRD